MRYILIILLFNSAHAQDYAISWLNPVKKEPGIVNYQIQTSANNISFTTIPNGTILPKKLNDTNKYSFKLPVSDYWVRIKTLFTNTVIYTPSKKIVNTNVSITNAILKVNPSADNLSFVANNESEAEYYSITRKNNSSSNYVIVGKLMQSNKKNYAVNISKVGNGRVYRLQVFYKNGIVSQYTNFQ